VGIGPIGRIHFRSQGSGPGPFFTAERYSHHDLESSVILTLSPSSSDMIIRNLLQNASGTHRSQSVHISLVGPRTCGIQDFGEGLNKSVIEIAFSARQQTRNQKA